MVTYYRLDDDDLQVRLAFIATKSDEASPRGIISSLGLQHDAEYQLLNDNLNERESNESEGRTGSPSKRARSESLRDSMHSPMKRRRNDASAEQLLDVTQ